MLSNKKKSSDAETDVENPIDKLENLEMTDNFEYLTSNKEEDTRFYYQEHNYVQKLYFFFTTPFMKFMYHSLFFLMFLILFSYVLLCDFYLIGSNTSETSRYVKLIHLKKNNTIFFVLFFAKNTYLKKSNAFAVFNKNKEDLKN